MAVAIQAYYDGSGNPDNRKTRFLTLAGYVGTPEAWQECETQWEQVLESWNCAYLHMKDANALRGEFARAKGWTHDKVRQLQADLFNKCLSPTGWEKYKGQFLGASCTINMEDYRKARFETPNLKEPEAICVDYVVTIALMALPENLNLSFGKEGTVELFFDKNESFMCKVDRIWRSKPRKKLNGLLQLVTGISQLESRDAIGLQAADFLAWSTNRYYTHGLNDVAGSFAGLSRILACPSYNRYYDCEGLQALQLKMNEQNSKNTRPAL